MSEVLPPRASGRLVSDTSHDVTVNREGVARVAAVMADCIKSGEYSIQSWKQHELNPKTMDKVALDWIFVADTLNFSFWSEDEDTTFVVNYNGKPHTGYWSLCAAMNRAIDDGTKMTDAAFYAGLTHDQLAHILRSDSDTEIPMLDERLAVLKEAGNTLCQKFGGSFVNVVNQCNNSAQTLLQMIVENFPSYRDETDYNGQRIAFYKRAQILIADIWACFEGEGLGKFNDIDTITMFADYRIPQALLYFGALQYSERLKDYLAGQHMLQTGDRYEVEIRGCSIWATELATEATREILANDPVTKDLLVNSILIDHYLWDYRRAHKDEMKDLPFHHIRCIYY